VTIRPAETSQGLEGSNAGTAENPLQLWIAWLLLAAFTLLVLFLGGETFSAARSYRTFAEVVRFFQPEATSGEIWFLFLWARKLAHAVEYGLLALFAFRAARLSFRNPIARIALLAGGFTALVASADELRQASLGSRTGSLLDFWIDVVAGAVSLGLLLLLREHRARKSAAREQPAA